MGKKKRGPQKEKKKRCCSQLSGWMKFVPLEERAAFFHRYDNIMTKQQRKKARSKYIEMNKELARKRKGLRRARKASACAQCVYIPHPSVTQAAVCSICNCQRPEDVTTAFYNKLRRQYKAALGLSSLVAPLTDESQAALALFADEFGLESNTSVLHTTLLEGLRQAETYEEGKIKDGLLSSIGNALRSDPSCARLSVKSLQPVPTRRDETRALVIAQMESTSPVVNGALQEAVTSDWCALPQWPLHCALGVAASLERAEEICYKKGARERLNELLLALDSTIHLDPFHVSELPAPPLEESESQTRMVKSLPHALPSSSWLHVQAREMGLPGGVYSQKGTT